jgi:hypothetical protein
MVKAGHNLKAIADYCGTSAAMIEENYCGTLSLSVNATVLPPSASNYAENLVAGPGFEPDPSQTNNSAEVLVLSNFKGFKKSWDPQVSV